MGDKSSSPNRSQRLTVTKADPQKEEGLRVLARIIARKILESSAREKPD